LDIENPIKENIWRRWEVITGDKYARDLLRKTGRRLEGRLASSPEINVARKKWKKSLFLFSERI